MRAEEPPTEWHVRDPATMGRALAYARRSRSMTQAVLAERAGITRQALADLESGRSTLQTERLFRVLSRLGMELVVTDRR